MFYNKHLQKREPITYTQIRTEKKVDRIDIRIEPSLKKIIEEMLEEKGMKFSECTRLLWLDYLQKTGKLNGFKKETEFIYGINWEL